MALNLLQKKAVVKEVSGIVADSQSIVVAEYLGLTVTEMTELRRAAIAKSVVVRVVKNTLARKALEGTSFECMNDVLTGPVVLAFSQESLGGAARVMREFAKDHDKLQVTGLSLGDGLMGLDQLKAVADLPSKDEAISMLMSVMKAPIEKLARTTKEVPGKLVRTVAAVRDQKETA